MAMVRVLAQDDKSYVWWMLDRAAVDRGVAQRDFAAFVLVDRIHDAGVEGAGVEVEAYRTFAKLAGVTHVVDGIQRVYGDGMTSGDFDDVGRHDVAVLPGQIFRANAVIVHREAADGSGH